MNYKYFYTDYCEDKEILGANPCEAELEQIIHSMDCVLHMPDNFIGIVNDKDQTVQFVVEKDNSITIDVPIVQNGKYIESKQKNTTLAECLAMVRSLVGTEDFYQLLPSESKSLGTQKPWWKLW